VLVSRKLFMRKLGTVPRSAASAFSRLFVPGSPALNCVDSALKPMIAGQFRRRHRPSIRTEHANADARSLASRTGRSSSDAAWPKPRFRIPAGADDGLLRVSRAWPRQTGGPSRTSAQVIEVSFAAAIKNPCPSSRRAPPPDRRCRHCHKAMKGANHPHHSKLSRPIPVSYFLTVERAWARIAFRCESHCVLLT
jgi:hypothetical protein